MESGFHPCKRCCMIMRQGSVVNRLNSFYVLIVIYLHIIRVYVLTCYMLYERPADKQQDVI